jgi:hypothetical protein
MSPVQPAVQGVTTPAYSPGHPSGARLALVVAIAATVVTCVLATWMVWDGPTQFLDAGSYASAIDSLAHGHGLTTTLAPSFSAFSATDFLRRGGRIPFVDFPAGYPVVATAVALATGAKRAMQIVSVVASAAAVFVVAVGPRRSQRDLVGALAKAVAGVALVFLPISRAVAVGGLSEPVFIVLVLLIAKLTIDGDDRRLHAAVLLGAAAGMVRFVGVLAVVVPVSVVWRRHGAAAALRWGAAAVGIVALNVGWASAQGTGHRFQLRSIGAGDMRSFVHSVGGWAWHGSGSFDLRNAAPPAWAVLLAVAWVVAVGVALSAMIIGRPALPPELAVCGALAGLLGLGVVAAMLTFDSLVTLDNRLMLPSGVLTVVGLVWWLAARPLTAGGRLGCLVGAAAWGVLAVGPWDVVRLRDPPPTAGLAAAVAGNKVVLSNGADHVWWFTGAPTAYLPLSVDTLTGERVDVAAEMEAVPCLLAAHRGVIVVFDAAFTDPTALDLLPAMVDAGQLTSERIEDVDVYRPTGVGC